MQLNTVIFDMDGLLIDSEPLWKEAAEALFLRYGKQLTAEEYLTTTGLRTKEFLEHWFSYFNLPEKDIANAETIIVNEVIRLVQQKGRPMPGVEYIFNFFRERNFKIGLASSSPIELIDLVVELLGIKNHLQAISSAAGLAYGKPHPEVYLICAGKLNAMPSTCVCFEDSFNGMVAAKAAKMKCVVVPSLHDSKKPGWAAADLKISTLTNFNELLLNGI
ncbi:MAG: hexitol phosphatase HxpB [Ferruginibacter sp.]|nr:hexitol phosphatase HxpB [Ferruginibacter sp.]